MKKVKRFCLTGLLLLGATAAEAQETIETAITADVVSQYVWRGQDLGNVSLQPTLGISYKGLSLSAWGSVGLTEAGDTKELDLTLSYTLGRLTVGITDYWFSTGLDPESRYFKYGAHATNHVFEAAVGYDLGTLSLGWYTNFAGNDGTANDGTANDGRRAYSSYIEANVPFRLAGVAWTATAGAVPWATTSYGTTGLAVTNVALKAARDIRITDSFAIPVFAEVAANPCAQRAHLVFGFTLQK